MLSALIKMAKLSSNKVSSGAKARSAGKRAGTQTEIDFTVRTHGGTRPGAGRKKKPGKKDPAHRKRPAHRSYQPVHVVMRVRKDVPRLRQGRTYRAIRRAVMKCLGQRAFRVCHLSIQGNHLHFLVEAANKRALGSGMQRLNILAAKALNRELRRKGSVFEYRYHATAITNPRQARNALAYVLNNWRRHREDEGCERARWAALDPYATGLAFDGWANGTFRAPADFAPLQVDEARTWLIRVGWKRHAPIDVQEVPGPMLTR
jgi:hypothetical protein